MSYQADIYQAIKDSAELTALIGDRFFWDVADPAPADNYLVAQVISGSGETDFDGDRSVSFPLIQFSAWSKTKVGAIRIAAALRRELEGRTLPGLSDVSLGYSGEGSTYERDTKLFGESIDYRASTLTN
jgi:hypothetical protein